MDLLYTSRLFARNFLRRKLFSLINITGLAFGIAFIILIGQYLHFENLATLISIFSVLAVVISCMGIFGLAVFQSEQRVKEIGVRKVLGATTSEITAMLAKNFTKWVIIANILAWPLAWYAMNKWLQNFAYRIEMSWWMFVLAGGIALIIALLTISWQAITAATANPVEALRCE